MEEPLTIISQYAGLIDLKSEVPEEVLNALFKLVEEDVPIEDVAGESPSSAVLLCELRLSEELLGKRALFIVLEKGARSPDQLATRLARGKIVGWKFPAFGSGILSDVYLLAKKGEELIFAKPENFIAVRSDLIGLRGIAYDLSVDSPVIEVLDVDPADVLQRKLICWKCVKEGIEGKLRSYLEELGLSGEIISALLSAGPEYIQRGSRMEMLLRDYLSIISVINALKELFDGLGR